MILDERSAGASGGHPQRPVPEGWVTAPPSATAGRIPSKRVRHRAGDVRVEDGTGGVKLLQGRVPSLGVHPKHRRDQVVTRDRRAGGKQPFDQRERTEPAGGVGRRGEEHLGWLPAGQD